jgi:hypothetical protein
VGLGEEVLNLDPEGAGDLAKGPHLRLSAAVLDGVQRLRRDPGLPGKHARRHAFGLSQFLDLPRVDHADHHTLFGLTFQTKYETMRLLTT